MGHGEAVRVGHGEGIDPMENHAKIGFGVSRDHFSTTVLKKVYAKKLRAFVLILVSLPGYMEMSRTP